jgi:hypothetical protein
MLERLPDLPPARHHVAMMHYWPFMEQPDEPAWDLTDPDQYDNWYFSIDRPIGSDSGKLAGGQRRDPLLRPRPYRATGPGR